MTIPLKRKQKKWKRQTPLSWLHLYVPEKGFKRAIIRKHHDLLYKLPAPQAKSNPLRIITHFSSQHPTVRRIVQKNWHVLTMDPIAGPLVPKCPAFIFRRTRSLKDKLVSSKYKGGANSDPCKRLETFKCDGYNYCEYMDMSNIIILPNGEKSVQQHFANWKTKGVVYLLRFDCSCFYVGKRKWSSGNEHTITYWVCNRVVQISPWEDMLSHCTWGRIPQNYFLDLKIECTPGCVGRIGIKSYYNGNKDWYLGSTQHMHQDSINQHHTNPS